MVKSDSLDRCSLNTLVSRNTEHSLSTHKFPALPVEAAQHTHRWRKDAPPWRDQRRSDIGPHTTGLYCLNAPSANGDCKHWKKKSWVAIDMHRVQRQSSLREFALGSPDVHLGHPMCIENLFLKCHLVSQLPPEHMTPPIPWPKNCSLALPKTHVSRTTGLT